MESVLVGRDRELALEIGDLNLMGLTHYNLRDYHLESGNPKKALEHYRSSLEARESIGDAWGKGFALCRIGTVIAARRSIEESLEYFEK